MALNLCSYSSTYDTFSTAPTGQVQKQLPQWRQCPASRTRGAASLMQLVGQALPIQRRKNSGMDLALQNV